MLWFKNKNRKLFYYISSKELYNFQFVVEEPKDIGFYDKCKGFGYTGEDCNNDGCILKMVNENIVQKGDIVCKQFRNGDIAFFEIKNIKYGEKNIYRKSDYYKWQGKRIKFNDLLDNEKDNVQKKFKLKVR